MDMLTADQQFVLAHCTMFGIESYPLRKHKSMWFVEGIRGIGSCPTAFKTKREALAQWHSTLDLLAMYKYGHIKNPVL